MTTHKKMTVTQLTFLTAINMMGSGIIMLPTKLASVGTISVLSWLVTAVGSMALAYIFAKCGRFNRNSSGGMGAYAEYAFGKAGSQMVNYTYGISLVIANVAIAIAAVGYGETLIVNILQTFQISTPHISESFQPFLTAILAIVLLWLTTVANFGGVSVTGKIGSVTVLGVIIPVMVLSILGWFWFKPGMYLAAWNPHGFSFWNAVGMSIPMTLWAFLGLESACANSDAVENPEKNVPIAVLVGTLGTAIVYIASTNVMAGIVPNLDLANSNAPFGLVFSTMFGPVVGLTVTGLMIISCLGSLLGWQFTIAEVFKTSAKEKYFISVFAKLNHKGVPIVAMLILTTIQTLLALLTISPQLSYQFEKLTNLAVVTNVVPYIICMASIVAIFAVSKISHKDAMVSYVIAGIASIYSFYALYTTGPQSMMYGALVTFFGWTLFAFVSHRFIEAHEPIDTSLIDIMERTGNDIQAQISEMENYLNALKKKNAQHIAEDDINAL